MYERMQPCLMVGLFWYYMAFGGWKEMSNFTDAQIGD